MIQCAGLAVRVGRGTIGPVTFTVPTGAYAVLTGPTGSGKTTLLEAIAGLRPVAAGHVTLDGVDVTHAPPAARGVGYAPQDAAVFARLTVADNLGFALAVRRAPASLIRARVAELAADLGLTHLLDRRAADLSGGEAQRVALGRAVAHRPRVLLLDEPLSALDAATRDRVTAALARWHARDGFTALHSTHHPDDAAGLATARLDVGELLAGG